MRFLIALVLITSACSKSDKQSGGSECDAAVARGVDETISKRRGNNAPPMTPEEAQVPQKLKAALAKSCVDDKWSAEVIKCFKTADDIATCKNQLTPEQRGAYTRAAMGVMQGARGMGGMPGHGMGGPGMGGPPPGAGMGGPPGAGMGGPPGGSPPSGSGDGSAAPAGSGAAPAGSGGSHVGSGAK